MLRLYEFIGNHYIKTGGENMEYGWVSEGNYSSKVIGSGNLESRYLFDKVIAILKKAGNQVSEEEGKRTAKDYLELVKLYYIYSQGNKEWQPYFSTISNLNEDYGQG